MTKDFPPECPECSLQLAALDIPAGPQMYQCENCGNVFQVGELDDLIKVTEFFEKLKQGDDRLKAALSSEHHVTAQSIMEMIWQWRARSEMDVLALIGLVQQRLGVLDNRLHSIKKRLAESLLGEPTPIDINEILELVDECIDMASPAPAKERGIKERTGPRM